MIQHVHRKLAKSLPAVPEVSIPISSLLQTTTESVLHVRLRFGTVLLAGLIVMSAVRPDSIPAQVLIAAPAPLCFDRSGLIYLKIRRLR
ncbi:hypothetical protein [Streptomyces palmae]|uniref:Uncharacterized protein n=1 Tax=Streptomyces palmae TaxID=1701085 RepID=A0A4Z0HIZ4_9ACTN|nr:hypothetical protein [Streptomyces palmae]TGB19600.1 hypothetical protein E4099_00150 [Streptomyces palmae]